MPVEYLQAFKADKLFQQECYHWLSWMQEWERIRNTWGSTLELWQPKLLWHYQELEGNQNSSSCFCCQKKASENAMLRGSTTEH